MFTGSFRGVAANVRLTVQATHTYKYGAVVNTRYYGQVLNYPGLDTSKTYEFESKEVKLGGIRVVDKEGRFEADSWEVSDEVLREVCLVVPEPGLYEGESELSSRPNTPVACVGTDAAFRTS